MKAASFFWIGLLAGVTFADAPYPVLLQRCNDAIQKNPGNYLKRSERVSLYLEHGGFTLAKIDIDTLLSHPEWINEGNSLEATRLFDMGRLDEAKTLIQKNIDRNAHVEEQSRMLASIELNRKDTTSAIAAFRIAWEQGRDENDYIDLLSLYRDRGKAPEYLLQQGAKIYPHSAGAIQTIFETYFAAGKDYLDSCLTLSERAEKTLWPMSVDWKLKHAQTLIAMKRFHEAEPALLAALDLIDSDPRMQGENGKTLHQQIFRLLEISRKTPPK